MTIDKRKIEKIKKLAKLYGATRLILFGSAVDKPKEAQDIDLACDGVEGWKLYEFAARIEEELSLNRLSAIDSPFTFFQVYR